MTPSSLRRVRWLFIGLSLADLVLTWVLLRQGDAYEANPLARRILERSGWIGLTAFKLAIIALVVVLLSLVGRYRPEAALRGLRLGCLMVGLVVCYSVALAAIVQPIVEWQEERAQRAEDYRERGIDAEFARSRAYAQRMKKLAAQIVDGEKSLPAAVAELDAAAEPEWMVKFRQLNPGLSRRAVVEQHLVHLTEQLRQETPARSG